MVNEKKIDFAKEDFFNNLKIDTFKSDVEYSSISKYAFISNSVRWGFASSDETYNIERKNRLTAIAAVMWALSDLSEKKDSLFSRGSYTIIDPNHNLFNFFLDYVKFVTGSEDPTQTHCALTQSNFAYRRLPEKGGSSHHLGSTPTGQFGIDMRFEGWETLMKILPFSMAHVLFGQLDMGQEQPLLFVKPEPVGLGSKGEFFGHSFHFLNSGHVEVESRREKDIKPQVAKAFQRIVEAVDFDVPVKTVRDMLLAIRKIERVDILSETLSSAIDEFNVLIETLYPREQHEIRIGNEVIIDMRKL